MKNKLFLFFLLIVFVPISVFAHQPRVVSGQVINVEDPEISKAYYGELFGAPNKYIIDSQEEFNFYISISVPANINPDGRFSARVYNLDKERQEILFLDSSSKDWEMFHEPFGNDDYIQGPELKKILPAGQYEIEVFNIDNIGRYVLAVGEKEFFPPSEIASSMMVIPKLKKEFFEVSPITFLFSPFGVVYIIFMFLFSFVFSFIYRAVLRRISKNKVRQASKNISSADRWLRAFIGLVLFVWAISTSWSPILLFFSGFCFFEAIFSWCGFYAAIGKNTCPI
jgi:hypothetical protein